MRILATALVITLAGCAAPAPPQPSPALATYLNYVRGAKPLAEDGNLKWSEYYGRVYDLSLAAGLPATHLQRVSGMIDNSLQLERGTISLDQFMALRRSSQIAGQAEFQENSRQASIRSEARAREDREFYANFKPFQPIPNFINTQPQVTAFPAPAMSNPATVTAIWTGKQTQVQTVTYQSGWSCEYQYAGRFFWRTFTTSCPSSVQVQ